MTITMNITNEQATFLAGWYLKELESEIETTKKVLAAVPDAKHSYKPDPKAKSAFELAWHICSSDVWFLEGIVAGKFEMEGTKEIPVKTTAEIVKWYDTNISNALEKVRSLPVDKLTRTIPFATIANMPAVAYLGWVQSHSVHHRGQLSTYLRPMGSKVPSIYGGSADEPMKF